MEWSVDTAKRVYNWFFHAFGSEDNPKCTQDDIKLKDDLFVYLFLLELLVQV